MHKGQIRIVTGWVLIMLQALAVLGNPDAGFFFSTQLPLQSILYLLAYWAHAICGTVLLQFGLRAKRTYEDVSLEVNGAQEGVLAVIKYAVAAALTVCLGVCVAELVDRLRVFLALASLSSVYFTLLCALAQIFMIVYLLFYMGRKPSHLIPAALGFSAAAYFYAIIPFMGAAFGDLHSILTNGLLLLGAGLYTALAVCLLWKGADFPWNRLMAAGGSLAMLSGSFLPMLLKPELSFSVPVDAMLHVSILVYCVFLKKGEENHG